MDESRAFSSELERLLAAGKQMQREAEEIHLRMDDLFNRSGHLLAQADSFVEEARIQRAHHEAERNAFDLMSAAATRNEISNARDPA